MNISINWIKDFVNLNTDNVKELGDRFTLATCEVENINVINSHLEKIIVAEILEIENHPNSDKLHLVTIDKGEAGKQKVVCGAPNVKVGIKVPFAPLGTKFSEDFIITPREIRGVLSEGMLCSEVELGLGDDDSGLMVFNDDAPVGKSIAQYLKKSEDIIFIIDNKSITHRPDLWAVYGMAREFAAVHKLELKNPFNKEWEDKLLKLIPDGEGPVKVSVSKDSACKAYYGLSVKNIEVKESPEYIKTRLLASGMRPINNIVDISNYVMLELGLPNHIFDASKIKSGKIQVKRPTADLDFTTLDEVVRKIKPVDTLICDDENPVAIAGVMGGLESGIADTTNSVFIEVANFVDSQIRKTSTRLGLRTDASQRFEKNLDSKLLKRTILRILELLKEQSPSAEVCGALQYDGEDLDQIKPLVIKISCQKIREVLGKEVENSEIVAILERLDFKVKNTDSILDVEVPSYRATKDIECEADIIEEIGRIEGFDNITPISPLSKIEPVRLPLAIDFQRKVQDFLVLNGGCLEVLTYPMIGKSLLDKVHWPITNDKLTLINAISTENDRMRPSLIPSALQVAMNNCKNFSNFKFFELGRSYLEDEKDFRKEKSQLIIGCYDKKENQFIKLINLVENMISFLNLPAKVEFKGGSSDIIPNGWDGIHPYDNLDIKILGKNSGIIFTVHPSLCSSLKINGNLSLAVLDITDAQNSLLKDKTKYKPLQKFPSSIFDCSVVAKKDEPIINIIKALKTLNYKELQEIKVVDIFTLDESNKSVTIRTVFADENKTLSGEFIETAKNKIVDILTKAGFPLKL